MRNSLPLISALALLLALAGCRSTNTIEPAEQRTAPNAIALSRIINDGGVDKRAFVRSVYEGRADDLLTVQVNVVNQNGATLGGNAARGVKYKFDWFDAQGQSVYDPTGGGYKRLALQTKEFATISAVAPTPAVVDWRLSLQSWKGK